MNSELLSRIRIVAFGRDLWRPPSSVPAQSRVTWKEAGCSRPLLVWFINLFLSNEFVFPQTWNLVITTFAGLR